MTAVVIEVALPVEAQNVTGALEYREKLAQAATEFGWAPAHTTDTKVQLAGNVPVNIALQREKRPIAVALHWEVDSDHTTIHRVLAAMRDQFDIEYATVAGALVPAPVEAYGLAGCLTD